MDINKVHLLKLEEENIKLCKLIGIKPLYIMSCKWYDRALNLGCNIGSIVNYREDCPNANYDDKDICNNCQEKYTTEQYPLLFNPNNFIKLIQLTLDSFEGLSLTNVGQVTGYSENVQQELIQRLISCLETNSCLSIIVPENNMTTYYNEEAHINFFKQQTQQIEFTY